MHANRALDIMAIRGKLMGGIDDVDNLHVSWWQEAGQTVLRIWSTAPMAVRTGLVTVEVRDAQGNLVMQPEPKDVWHESFRYFRLSQITDDFFDAFRNLYLALEVTLSTLTPQSLSAKGKPNERESDWFKRALTQAGTLVDLKRYLPPGASVDPVQELFDEFYVRVRTAVFHAKAGRLVLIPLDMGARAAVLESLSRLGQLYVDLVGHVLQMRFASGGLFASGFRLMAKHFVDGGQIHLTDDPRMSEEDASVASTGHVSSIIPSRHGAEFDEPFFVSLYGEELAASVVRKLPNVAKVVATFEDGTPAIGATIEASLELDGVSRVQAVMGLRAINARMLRRRYTA